MYDLLDYANFIVNIGEINSQHEVDYFTESQLFQEEVVSQSLLIRHLLLVQFLHCLIS